jgi:hypothetical protein
LSVFGQGLEAPTVPDDWEWVAPGLGEPGTVSAIVPRGFEGYARIEHEGAPGDDGLGLPVELLTRLVAFLTALTTTPERACFAIWEGYGWDTVQLAGSRSEPPRRWWRRAPVDPFADATDSIAESRDALAAELSSLPVISAESVQRRYHVLAGPVDAVLHMHDPISVWSRRVPDLWWPRDRAWFVGSDTDLTWTYLAGSAEMVDILLEGWPKRVRIVQPTDRIE